MEKVFESYLFIFYLVLFMFFELFLCGLNLFLPMGSLKDVFWILSRGSPVLKLQYAISLLFFIILLKIGVSLEAAIKCCLAVDRPDLSTYNKIWHILIKASQEPLIKKLVKFLINQIYLPTVALYTFFNLHSYMALKVSLMIIHFCLWILTILILINCFILRAAFVACIIVNQNK